RATNRREAADFDTPEPLGAGMSPSGSRTDPAILKKGIFWDSQIRGNMIHARDGDFGVAVVWPEGGLRCVPGPSQGAERQHRHGGFRFGGVRHVLHAERVISVLPADAGEGPRTVELPDLVRN